MKRRIFGVACALVLHQAVTAFAGGPPPKPAETVPIHFTEQENSGCSCAGPQFPGHIEVGPVEMPNIITGWVVKAQACNEQGTQCPWTYVRKNALIHVSYQVPIGKCAKGKVEVIGRANSVTVPTCSPATGCPATSGEYTPEIKDNFTFTACP